MVKALHGVMIVHKIDMIYEDEGENNQWRALRTSVSLERDGSLDHFCDTFEAFLIACGYAPETVKKLIIEWAEELKFPLMEIGND